MQLVLVLSAVMSMIVAAMILSYFVMIPVTYYDNKNNRDRYPTLYSEFRGKTDHELFGHRSHEQL